MHETVFDMSNEDVSFQFEDIVKENVSRYIPFAPGYLAKEGRGESSQKSKGESSAKRKG